MKKTIFTMALMAAACTAWAQQKCRFTGHLDGMNSDTLYVLVVNENFTGQERIDTVKTKNGDIDYTIECATLRQLVIVPAAGDVNTSLGKCAIQVVAMPGEHAVLSGSTTEYFYSGSKFYTDYNEYDKLTTPIMKKIGAMQDEFKKRVEANEDEEKVQSDIMPKYEAANKELDDVAKNFIKAHPASDVSGYLLAQVPADERDQYKALLSDAVKNGPTAQLLKTIEKREAAEKTREEAAKKSQPGCDAPDFTLPTIDGKQLTLSSLKGKIVVLDFWGSWCGWCIKGMPQMKVYYDKYKAKGLEILGVDCNDTVDKWKAAVEKHALPWLHVRNDGDTDVTALYGISGFPTKIVIGKDGKVLKVVVGEDPAFYTYLDELFK